MTDYNELVKALRSRSVLCESIDCDACEAVNFVCTDKILHDAAAAIEDLQAEVDKYKTAWAVERENRLGIEEPKRGEWIKHPEVKNIYGGEIIECPFCGEKYVVQYIADEKFCRNCGADMRAKMEEAEDEVHSNI